jgi:integrase-like protein
MYPENWTGDEESMLCQSKIAQEVYVRDYGTPREAMQGYEKCFQLYNRQRPHQALGSQTPATVSGGSYV